MKTLRSILAITISVAIMVESVQALPMGASNSAFSLPIPSSLGYVSSTYSPSKSPRPDFILIQDLHVNRSVQFAISRILKQLKKQGLMPDRIAVEGETGPVEIQPMQATPDPSIRKRAADYLVTQGEMPGAMHFAVSEGEGGLFGIETDEYYQANLEMFRRSYTGRSQLRSEIEKIQAVLPRLQKDPATRENASLLSKDLQAVSQLINNQVIPDELLAILGQASAAVDRLKLVLPKETANELVEPLSASINFYALALLRNEELFKNAEALRAMGRQKTTIVVAGGFHTEALTELCKKKGFSYAVITPNIRHHTRIDETLYVERLLGHHLTPEQVATGQNWAAMQMLAVAAKVAALSVWPAAVKQTKAVLPLILTAALLGYSSADAPQLVAQEVNQTPAPPPAAVSTKANLGSYTLSGRIPADFLQGDGDIVFSVSPPGDPAQLQKFQITFRSSPQRSSVAFFVVRDESGDWRLEVPKTANDELRALASSIPTPETINGAGAGIHIPASAFRKAFNDSLISNKGSITYFLDTGIYVAHAPSEKLNTTRVPVELTVIKGEAAPSSQVRRQISSLNRADFLKNDRGSQRYVLMALTAGALLAATLIMPLVFHVDTTTMLKWGAGVAVVGLGGWWYLNRDTRDDIDKRKDERDAMKATIGNSTYQITVDKDGIRKTPLQQQPAPQITPKEPPKATPVKEDSTGGPKFHITVDKDGVRPTKTPQAVPQVTPAVPSKETPVKENSTEEVGPNEDRSKSNKSSFWVGGVVVAVVAGIISASLLLKPSQSPVEKPARTEQAAPAPIPLPEREVVPPAEPKAIETAPVAEPTPEPLMPPKLTDKGVALPPTTAEDANQPPAPAQPAPVSRTPGQVGEPMTVSTEFEYFEVTVTPATHVILRWDSGGYASNSNSRRTPDGAIVYRIDKLINGTLRAIKEGPSNGKVTVTGEGKGIRRQSKIEVPSGFTLRPAVYQLGQETAIQGIEPIDSLPQINSREGPHAFYADTTIDPTFLKNERGPTHFTLFVLPTKLQVPLTKVTVRLINLKKNEAVTVVAERSGNDWGWAHHANPIGKQKELLKKGYAGKLESSLNGGAPVQGVAITQPIAILYDGFRLEVLTDAPFTLTPTSEKVSAAPSQTAPAALPATKIQQMLRRALLSASVIAFMAAGLAFIGSNIAPIAGLAMELPGQTVRTLLPVVTTGIGSHVAGFGTYATAASAAVAVVFGMIFGLQQKNRDRKRTLGQVLAGFKRFPQAIRATPSAITELASSAQVWLKNTPMVQYYTRQKVAELANRAAQQAALVAAA